MLKAYFRKYEDAAIPPTWKPGIHWSVEAFDDAVDASYPLGVAYVSDYDSQAATVGEHVRGLVCLDFIIVPDQCRRCGVATFLYNACKERWPSIYVTGAISKAGEALLGSLDPAGKRQEHLREKKRQEQAERKARRKARKAARR